MSRMSQVRLSAARIPRHRTVAIAIALVALAACNASGSPAPNPYAPGGAKSPTTGAVPGSPIEGIVTEVDTQGVDKIRGFTIRTSDGASWTFEIRALENAAEFPPAHLVEHKATVTPVRVAFHAEGSTLVADRIEDAG